jgi:hypothetical protein
MPWPSLPLSMKGFLGRRSTDGAAARAASLTTRALSVPEFREALPELAAELERARRYEHPLAVLVLSSLSDPQNGRSQEEEPPPDGNGRILLETRIPHLASLLVATILTGMLRQSDRVTYMAADDRFVIALPETDREAAGRTVHRIEPVLKARIGVGLRAGSAAFPKDGLTMAELMDKAENEWRRRALEVHEASTDGASLRMETDR